jgi:hypothetical protein
MRGILASAQPRGCVQSEPVASGLRSKHPQRLLRGSHLLSRIDQQHAEEPWGCLHQPGRRALRAPCAAVDAPAAEDGTAVSVSEEQQLPVEDESLEILEWPLVCRQVRAGAGPGCVCALLGAAVADLHHAGHLIGMVCG